MLKRFYSKKSGFTLIEIVVAFAVFAIMASMIVQILELAINARNSNNTYAQELAKQERLLTVIDKDSDYFNDTDDTAYVLTIDGNPYKLDYEVKATDPTATNQAEGINYFLSPVDYQGKNAGAGGSGGGGGGSGSGSGGVGGMSQASRMDTRITGTAGIGDITIKRVIKDTFNYASASPFKLKEGRTRYWIEIAVNDQNAAGKVTLQEEDVPFSQIRLFFFSSDKKDATQSAEPFKDDKGKEYTKVVYQQAEIVDVGHIDAVLDGSATSVQKNGLSKSNTSDGNEPSSANEFLVQHTSANCIRIGTPLGGTPTRFGKSKHITFYVEFVGDPKLTVNSFGANGVKNDNGSVTYRACPMYPDKFNADGTPKYEKPTDGSVHPGIYGAYLHARTYGTPSGDGTK